jgi:hypothetical protein
LLPPEDAAQLLLLFREARVLLLDLERGEGVKRQRAVTPADGDVGNVPAPAKLPVGAFAPPVDLKRVADGSLPVSIIPGDWIS